MTVFEPAAAVLGIPAVAGKDQHGKVGPHGLSLERFEKIFQRIAPYRFLGDQNRTCVFRKSG